MLSEDIDFLGIIIPRKDIEKFDINPTLGILKSLFRDKSSVIKFKRLVSLSIDGYNYDSRELHQIPEVRKFMFELDKYFPYWFYFIYLKDGGTCLGFIARSLCKWKEFMPGLGEFDIIDMQKFLEKHLYFYYEIVDKYDLDKHNSNFVVNEILDALGYRKIDR